MTEKTIHENGHDTMCGLYGIDPAVLRENDYSDECACVLIRSIRNQYVGPNCLCSSCTKDRESDGDFSVGWHLEYLEDGIKDAELQLTQAKIHIENMEEMVFRMGICPYSWEALETPGGRCGVCDCGRDLVDPS